MSKIFILSLESQTLIYIKIDVNPELLLIYIILLWYRTQWRPISMPQHHFSIRLSLDLIKLEKTSLGLVLPIMPLLMLQQLFLPEVPISIRLLPPLAQVQASKKLRKLWKNIKLSSPKFHFLNQPVWFPSLISFLRITNI